MEALVRYPGPDNIRELQNVIQRSVVLYPGSSLQVPLGDLQPAATRHLSTRLARARWHPRAPAGAPVLTLLLGPREPLVPYEP